jgi:tetratricopeptide (TPR) repeat protein
MIFLTISYKVMAKREEKEFSKITSPEIDSEESNEGDVLEKAQGFVQKNGTLISVISVVIIIAVAAMVYFSNQAEENKFKAINALSRIQAVYDSGDFDVALNGDPNMTVRGEEVLGLIDISDKYGSTEQGKLASLYAGNSYIALGDYANAKEYFEKASGSEAKLVRSGAYAGIAACQDKEGKYNDAASNYEKAANLSFENEIKFRYLLFAALNYEKAEKKDKAIQLYKDIVLMNERTQFADEAKLGLARLGTVIE